jgi:hypothetical protein
VADNDGGWLAATAGVATAAVAVGAGRVAVVGSEG